MANARLRGIEPIFGDSYAVGGIAPGCQQCAEGAKLVLFITGVCHWTCFYCPVGTGRRNKDVVYADERRVDPEAPDALARIFAEARSIGAKGTGITGGDPMYRPERVVRYCKALKEEFGTHHHIHLYTQIDFPVEWLPKLKAAGLDEIRFHPPVEHWPTMDSGWHSRLIPAAQAAGLTVGVEVPVLPEAHDDAIALIRWCEARGVAFVNLNELEFSETNAEKLRSRGYDYAGDENNRVAGAREAALRVLEASRGLRVPVHYCSSPFKDRVQLGQRLTRRAKRVGRPHEIVTDEGLLLRGVVEAPGPREMRNSLMAQFDIPPDLIVVRNDRAGRERLEVAPWVLEAIAKEVPVPCYLSECYPTEDDLEVERTPLN